MKIDTEKLKIFLSQDIKDNRGFNIKGKQYEGLIKNGLSKNHKNTKNVLFYQLSDEQNSKKDQFTTFSNIQKRFLKNNGMENQFMTANLNHYNEEEKQELSAKNRTRIKNSIKGKVIRESEEKAS